MKKKPEKTVEKPAEKKATTTPMTQTSWSPPSYPKETATKPENIQPVKAEPVKAGPSPEIAFEPVIERINVGEAYNVVGWNFKTGALVRISASYDSSTLEFDATVDGNGRFSGSLRAVNPGTGTEGVNHKALVDDVLVASKFLKVGAN